MLLDAHRGGPVCNAHSLAPVSRNTSLSSRPTHHRRGAVHLTDSSASHPAFTSSPPMTSSFCLMLQTSTSRQGTTSHCVLQKPFSYSTCHPKQVPKTQMLPAEFIWKDAKAAFPVACVTVGYRASQRLWGRRESFKDQKKST